MRRLIRLSWRRLLITALVTMAMTAMATTALAGGTLRVASMGEPASLDPHKVSGTWENYVVGDMFVGLTTENPKAEPIPGVAESWTVSEDGKTYTFKLRECVWSDGTPMTAHDFVFSMQRILDPQTAAEYASLLYIIEGAEAVNKAVDP